MHGKDGLRKGSFGDHVKSMKLIKADGSVETLSNSENNNLFSFAIGGMRLFGFIVEADIQLFKIPSTHLSVEKIATKNIENAFEIMSAEEMLDFDYAIGWLDTFARGANIGRGFMTRARWIDNRTEQNRTERPRRQG